MKKVLSFDDVLITPRFSEIKSRKDVDLTQYFFGSKLTAPFISSNMDTVTDHKMARAIYEAGGIGSLHRFCSIEDNVKMFQESPVDTIVSIGLGDAELERAEALSDAGAIHFLIDVAHGSSMEVVKQYDDLQTLLDPSTIVVGNFATASGIQSFKYHAVSSRKPNMYKVGIGGGSACLTRVVTGCGMPTFASILDCSSSGEVLIADGGIRNSGDAAKALAAGAMFIMMGKMFAGCKESPGEIYYSEKLLTEKEFFPSVRNRETGQLELIVFEDAGIPQFKKYRGSASAESYTVQGKTANHRAPEGDSFLIPYTGPVQQVVNNLTAGIKSACSYVGANNLTEFRELVEFVQVTPSGAQESQAHGKS